MDTSIVPQIVERVYEIALFLIATDWFSRISVSKFFGFDS